MMPLRAARQRSRAAAGALAAAPLSRLGSDARDDGAGLVGNRAVVSTPPPTRARLAGEGEGTRPVRRAGTRARHRGSPAHARETSARWAFSLPARVVPRMPPALGALTCLAFAQR